MSVSIARGQAYQLAYQATGNTCGDDYKTVNKYMFKAVAYSAKTSGVRKEISRTVENEMAETHEASKRLMGKWLAYPGFAFLQMSWRGASDGHAMALLKLSNGNIFLYDPNCGLLEHEGAKSGLYEQLKQYVRTASKVFCNYDLKLCQLLGAKYNLQIKYRV